MSTEVLLPKIGFAMNEAVLSQWLVDDGGSVEAGQPLYCIESDKSVEEIPAPVAGTLTIIAAIGETYPVGTVLAQIL
jgi:pyruvate/2-oxoglutarate dehydrogenase complex dihydrolipoamide acyltransferase (E2) component